MSVGRYSSMVALAALLAIIESSRSPGAPGAFPKPVDGEVFAPFSGRPDTLHGPPPARPPASAPGPGRHTTTPPPGGAIVWGTVETTYGDVAPGRRLELYSGTVGRRYITTTDSEGGFKLDGIAPAADYVISLDAQGAWKAYLRGDLRVDSSQTALRIVLEPLRMGLLEGRIVNSANQPVPDMEITLHSLSAHHGLANTRSDSVGTFRVEAFPEGPFEVSAQGNAFRAQGLRFDPGSSAALTLVMDRGHHELTGQVYGAYGQPRAGATVVLTWVHSDSGARSVMERRVLTDTRGSFSIKGLGAGEHEFVLAAGGSAGLRRSLDIGRDPVDLILYLQ